MAGVRFEWNNQGFRDILGSAGVEQLVLEHAQQIAQRASAGISEASEGFTAEAVKAPTRYIAFASTTDRASVEAESENKVLSRAVY